MTISAHQMLITFQLFGHKKNNLKIAANYFFLIKTSF